jgi:lipid-A-disaccharide synthase
MIFLLTNNCWRSSQEFNFYKDFISQENIKFISNKTYDLLRNSTAALVTSGTATLETALLKFQSCMLQRQLASYKLRNESLHSNTSLVNLIMDEEVVQN